MLLGVRNPVTVLRTLTESVVEVCPSDTGIRGFCKRTDSRIFLCVFSRQMSTTTVLTLSDVNHTPKVRKELPSPMRIGDHLHLHFTLRKRTGSRTEELLVQGEWRVVSVSFEVGGGPKATQLLTMEAVGATPTWKSVKTVPEPKRRLPPAVSGRTTIQ